MICTLFPASPAVFLSSIALPTSVDLFPSQKQTFESGISDFFAVLTDDDDGQHARQARHHSGGEALQAPLLDELSRLLGRSEAAHTPKTH